MRREFLQRQKQVDRINGIPAFLAKVKNHDEREYTVHFMGLFSERHDAIPVILSHGWPGCFLEFLPFLEAAKRKWKPEDLP
jgi:microsomal epoxide hydrolase